jgi:DNA-binding CsgD family transcriptional regulator
VLRAHGVESESELPYAGLHQLLRPVAGALDGLAAPQADALRAAFGLRVAEADDRFLVSLAVLSLLGEISERRPVLCALDDAHWLDRGSVDALAFVARRLQAERVALVVAVREPAPREVPLEDLPVLSVGGIDPDGVRQLLERHTRAPVHPDVGVRLATATNGNALALAELARTLTPEELRGDRPLPMPLPLTAGVEQGFRERVRGLPGPTQTLLLVAAADDTARATTVFAAAERLGIGPDAVDPAEEAGVVAADGATLRFRHPLVRSAVYRGATSTGRRSAHRALAAVLNASGDADRAAWHQAAGAVGPDENAVAALVAAAGRARGRAAFATAAAASRRASELTADTVRRGRLLTDAAVDAWRAGGAAAARDLVAQARPLVADPWVRADLDRLRGTVELVDGAAPTAYRILRNAALAIGSNDPRRALNTLALAGEAASLARDGDAVQEAGRLVGRMTVGDDHEAACLADLLIGFGHAFADDPGRAGAPLRRAVGRAVGFDDPELLLLAWRAALYLGDDHAAYRCAGGAAAQAREIGNVGLVAVAAGERLALSDLLAGRWAAAEAATEEARELASATGQQELVPLVTVWWALVAALRGQQDECRARVLQVVAAAAQRSMGLVDDAAAWVLGLLDLADGDAASALDRLVPIRHPLVVVLASLDRVEAAVQAGRADLAEAWVGGLSQYAEHAGGPPALARAAHGRALLADGAAAQRAYAEALHHHDAAARPFERARTELAFGVALRRSRRRADARLHLRAAFDRFEQLGAAPWAQRSQAELRACGQTVRGRADPAAGRLTPQETQVARFVADGLSNADVAARLFLSRRTVDFHLRNVFAKLGISSRSELVRFVLDSAAR